MLQRNITMNHLTYRIATIHDLQRIVDIYNSTIPSRMVTADLEPISVDSRIAWFNDHHPHKRPLWVIEDNHQNIVGWVSFQSFYGRPAYDATVEVSIYFDEDSRGKGYGKEALQFCIKQAPSFGIKTLLGFIFSHNIPSLQLFKKFGFEEWANLPHIAKLDDVERGLIIMGKRIVD